MEEDLSDEQEACAPTSVCVDIALGADKHRITLFADSDPIKTADDFARQHNLDQKLQKKLTEQLIVNLRNNFS